MGTNRRLDLGQVAGRNGRGFDAKAPQHALDEHPRAVVTIRGHDQVIACREQEQQCGGDGRHA